jgi:hypothetical protein
MHGLGIEGRLANDDALCCDAGKDMTTGLLLDDPMPPLGGGTGAEDAQPDDSGPMGQLRRRLTLLQQGAAQQVHAIPTAALQETLSSPCS